MRIGKEFKVLNLISVIMLIGLAILSRFSLISKETSFFSMLVCIICTLSADVCLLFLYKKIRGLRNNTDEMLENLSGEWMDFSDRYSEGELAKLFDSVALLISALKEAKDKSQMEKEYMKDMISDISHQLKTPIAALTLFNDLFLDNYENMDKEERENILNQTELQLERMKWLVQSMLQLARIEADAITFRKDDIHVNDLFESCANILEAKAKEKSQEIIIESDEDITIKTDAEWMQEALVNIIKNSIDYSPENGQIILGAKKTPIAVKLWVQDFGPGIKEDERIEVFERFYRSSGNTVNPNSVGIGLSLSKKIVEGCGGNIRVESRYSAECKADEKSYTKMIITF